MELKRQSMLTRRGLMRLIARHVAAAFGKWCTFYNELLNSCSAFQKSALQWQNIALARAMRKWLITTTRRPAVEEEEEEEDSDLVARLRAEIAELKAMLALCAGTCQHTPGCPVCKKDPDARLFQAIAAMRNFQLARAWRTWRALYEYIQHRNTMTATALARMRNRLLTKAYMSLKEHAQILRIIRAAIKRWNQRKVNEAWNTWLDWAGQKNEKLRLIRKGVSRMVLGPLAKMMDHWRDEAARLRRIEMLMRRAAMRWSKSRLYIAFNFMYDLCEARRLRELEFSAHLTTTYKKTIKPKVAEDSWFDNQAAPAEADLPMLLAGTPKTAANTLYVIGGQDGLGRSTPLVEKMNGMNGQWGLEGEYAGTARLGHGVVVAQGLIYMIGGRTVDTQNAGANKTLLRLSSMDILSTTDGVAVLKPGPAMSVKRNNVGVAYLKNKIYATGGGDGVEKAVASVEVFDVGTGEWNNSCPMQQRRCGHAVAAVQGKLYVIGGGDGQGKDLRSVECFNPLDEAWTEVKPMRHARVNAAVCAHNGFIFVFGGNSRDGEQSTMLDSVERYDPKQDKWVKRTHLPSARAYASAASCGGYIYLAGGQSMEQGGKYPVVLDSVLRYEVESNTWIEMPPLGMKRSHLCLAAARLAIELM